MSFQQFIILSSALNFIHSSIHIFEQSPEKTKTFIHENGKCSENDNQKYSNRHERAIFVMEIFFNIFNNLRCNWGNKKNGAERQISKAIWQIIKNHKMVKLRAVSFVSQTEKYFWHFTYKFNIFRCCYSQIFLRRCVLSQSSWSSPLHARISWLQLSLSLVRSPIKRMTINIFPSLTRSEACTAYMHKYAVSSRNQIKNE